MSFREFLSRLRFLAFRRGKTNAQAELDEELQFHVEQAIRVNLAAGVDEKEARRRALVDFGGVERAREDSWRERPGWFLETVLQDVRYALRGFRRNLGFTVTVIATLAVGIGATASIFSAVYSLLLRPLAYPDAARLMWVSNVWPKAHLDRVMSPNFIAARSWTGPFEQLSAFTFADGNLTGAGSPVRVTRASVSANFLATLGIQPQMGRDFAAGEDVGGNSHVVLLSDRLWRNQFQANPHILGSRITVDGVAQTVIGVLPPRFRFPDVQWEPDVYGILNLDPDTNLSYTKRFLLVEVIGRLRSGETASAAQAEMSAFFQARVQTYPVGFVHMAEGQRTVVESLQRHLTGDDRRPLLILLASVGFVLLIACANVANLQLARAVSRRHETALRGALGASRPRLIRQCLVESLLLAAFSAVLGLLIAGAVTVLIRRVQMPDAPQLALYSRAAQLLRLPFGKLSASIEVDGWVMAFTVGVGLVTTLLFGLLPAIAGTRADLSGALRTAALRVTQGRQQRLLRQSLLVAEVGLAVVLLASAGLLIRSFVNVLRFGSGFDASNTLTGVTLLNPSRYATGERIGGFVEQLLTRLAALPGVKVVAVSSVLPVQPYDIISSILFEGVAAPPVGLRPTVPVISVTPDYFQAVGTPILEGRTFSLSDTAGSVPVTIVNRAFAKRFFAGNALGKRFRSMAWGPEHGAVTIVGIEDDVRHGGLEQEVQPEMLVPMAQLPQTSISIAIRAAGNPEALAKAMRDAVAGVDAEQPVFDIQTMEHRVGEAVAERRLMMLLIGCFAMLAVLLGGVGVYGVFSYSVTQRAHEIGIRLALGASRRGLLRLVVMQAARLILVGGTLGVGAALGLSRLLGGLLVGVTPHDAASYLLAWALMTAVAVLASIIPAAKAARADLVSVLHSE